uniref:Uncharacterized protein n=1 Tax=Parascaris equorum TaxID=6256 RepID=A0A914S1J2_PAREQ
MPISVNGNGSWHYGERKVKMPKTREELFEKAKQLNESEKYDDAIELLKELTSLDIEVNNSEMELINWVTAGALSDDQYRDAGTYINEIKKNIGDAERGKEQLKDS